LYKITGTRGGSQVSIRRYAVERTKDHQLLDSLTIAICAILCGAEGPTGMETFGKAKEAVFN